VSLSPALSIIDPVTINFEIGYGRGVSTRSSDTASQSKGLAEIAAMEGSSVTGLGIERTAEIQLQQVNLGSILVLYNIL